jgi:vitamin B12 transporter
MGSVITIRAALHHRPTSAAHVRRVEDSGWTPPLRRSEWTATGSRRWSSHPFNVASSATLLAALMSTGRVLAADEEGEEVLVRGALVTPASREPSVASTVIKAKRLRAPGLRTADLLRSQPGLQVAESGGAGSLATAGVRGASSAQTPVYVGGIRINDDVAGTADLSLVPLWLMRRVEIYRGNAPVQADRAGIGGAIFFDPERPSNLRPTAGGMLGSFGARSGWAYTGIGDDRSAAAVGVKHEAVGNDYEYVSDRGTRFEPGNARRLRRSNADVRTTDVWVLGTTKLGARGRLDLLFNGVARTHGLPGLAVLPTEQANAAQQRELAAASLTVPCADERCTVTATTATLFGHVLTNDPLGELGLGSRRLETTAARVDESIIVRVGLSPRVMVTSVVRAAVEHLAIDSATAALLRAQRFTTTGAALVEWSVSDFATVRALTHVSCDATRSDTSPDATGASACGVVTPSARAGVEVGSRAVKLLMNVARYGRVPTLGERYGVSASVRGSEALRPEAAVGGDIGVRFHASVLDAEVFAFARRAEDLIAYVRSAPGYIVPYNVGRAELRGGEAYGMFSPWRFLEVDAAATLLDARDESPGRSTVNEILPFRSRLILAPRIALKAPGWRLMRLGRSLIAASYVYQSNRYADAAGLVVIPEQGNMDLEAMTETASGHVRARVRVANVLDQPRFDLVGFPLPGRAVYAAMEVQW